MCCLEIADGKFVPAENCMYDYLNGDIDFVTSRE